MGRNVTLDVSKETIQDKLTAVPNPTHKRNSCIIYKALILVLISSFLLSVNSVIVKFIRYMTASELAFARYSGMLVLNLPFLIWSQSKHLLNKSTFPVLLARAVFGCASLYLSYLGMKLMPIAESSVIVSTTPVWVALFSRIILKENLDWLNSVSILFTFIGLLLMSKVFLLIGRRDNIYDDKNYWYGCVASLSSSILGALTIVFIRKVKGVEESVTIAYQAAAGVILMPILATETWTVNLPNCGKDGAVLVILGIFSFLGQTMLTAALRLEKAGAVSCVRFSSRVILLFIFQVLIFKDIPDVYSISAAVCVTVSLWLSVLRKYRQYRRSLEPKNAVENNSAEEVTAEVTKL